MLTLLGKLLIYLGDETKKKPADSVIGNVIDEIFEDKKNLNEKN